MLIKKEVDAALCLLWMEMKDIREKHVLPVGSQELLIVKMLMTNDLSESICFVVAEDHRRCEAKRVCLGQAVCFARGAVLVFGSSFSSNKVAR